MLILLILLIVYFVFVIFRDTRTLSQLEGGNAGLVKSIEKEKAAETQLKAGERDLSKADHIELTARKKLGMIKKGETPFKVIRTK